MGEITFHLYFKPLSKAHENFANRQIELQLSSLTARNDRKAYANGARSGHSAIKEFFLDDLHLTAANNSSDYFAIYKASEFSYYLYYVPKLLHDNFIKFFESISPTVTISRVDERKSGQCNNLQQIFYGAPGTGKSHEVKKQTGELSANGEERDLPNVFRTTFHPDTDYASFVGCYKPTMRKTGKKHQVDGKDVDDEEIIYEFVPQTFTDAYIYAYKNPTEPTYLIIEEINRGNCAQIFGDLFQLLDRKGGTSEYKIKADKDLAKYLNDELGKDADGIKEGKLCLPANLNILATMNTSDQSLFPMDSAFKRRWDWKYIPIDIHKEQWNIVAEGVKYSWSSFLDIVNGRIFRATTSEDKQLGFYFCKAENKEISAEKFVSKVLFYLWNDVFKDYDEGDSIFKDADSNPMPFSEFFNPDGSVNETNVTKLLTALKVEHLDVKQIATTENGQGE